MHDDVVQHAAVGVFARACCLAILGGNSYSLASTYLRMYVEASIYYTASLFVA